MQYLCFLRKLNEICVDIKKGMELDGKDLRIIIKILYILESKSNIPNKWKTGKPDSSTEMG